MKLQAPSALALARAAAWALLLAGWVGIGSVALALAAGSGSAFALVAGWLLALGAAATVATRDTMRATPRRVALLAAAAIAALALAAATRGGGTASLLLALMAWAALTALASGVVRQLRLAQAQRPQPPVGAAALGAAFAALALADPADVQRLGPRLALLLLAAALLLAWLQPADRPGAAASRCRAGLFDCSLPAWPAGAWRELQQWPVLMAGLAMLPMMAALPLMAEWCRADALPAPAMVALHFVAMFAPALLLRRGLACWSARTLAAACTAALVAGAACALWAPPPLALLGPAFAQGLAWSLAWAGQLWAPDRRGARGASPLRAAIGYALLTLAFGAAIEFAGRPAFGATHAALGVVALLAFVTTSLRRGIQWRHEFSDAEFEHSRSAIESGIQVRK